MTVIFSKQHSNYHPQNLIDILQSIPDKTIKKLANDPVDYVKVIGDIHRSQFIADKPGLFWFKIKGYKDGKEVTEISSVHIYVCFRRMRYDKKGNKYISFKKCINPRPFEGTDIADITRLFGAWEYVDITYR